MEPSSSCRVLTRGGTGSSYVSVSGLANILKEVRDHGMPKKIGRSSIKRARDAEMPQDIFTTVELDMLDGSQRKFPAVDPSVQLQHLASTNEGFGEFLLSKLEMHPSDADHAWKIAIYSDEITPGDPLVANERKLVCFYFSFAEFDAALGSETLWFHLMSLRSIHLEQIKGGWSQVFEKACRLFFRSPLDMSLGLMLRPKGCDVRLLFARIGLVIGDEQALKMCFGFKGASGMKCCALCMNITLRHLQVADHDDSNWMVPRTETDISKMVFATSQSILDNVAALEAKAGRTSKAKFEKMEMSLGLNHVPEGPLSSPCFLNHLRGTLVDIISFDWMHCFLVSGLWNSEMGLLLQALKEHANIRPSDCHEFLSQFSWPNAQEGRGTTGRKVLKKHTEGELKCSASEGLSLYPIIRHMLAELVGNHPEPIVQGAIASYYSLADVLDLLVKNRLEQDISPVTLQTAITKYLQLRVGVYGPEHLPPKGHFINHLPFVLEKNPVLACWVHERKHRELKRLANNFTNANKTLSFENGLLRSAVLSQMHAVETLQVERGLELDSPEPASDTVQAHVIRFLGLDTGIKVLASMAAFVNPFTKCCAKDVAFTGTEVGEIWFHVSVDGKHLSCFSPWVPMGDNKFRKVDAPKFIKTSQIVKCLVVRQDSHETVTVVP